MNLMGTTSTKDAAGKAILQTEEFYTMTTSCSTAWLNNSTLLTLLFVLSLRQLLSNSLEQQTPL